MDNSEASTSSAASSSAFQSDKQQPCAICKQKVAIYTCPRCCLRSCSLQCSTTHKSTSGCSGQRDKAKYIPLKEYGYGALMDDYTFLEDIGRHVGDWGKEIAKQGLTAASSTGVARGMARMRGGNRKQGGRQSAKRDVLKMQLEAHDIDIDFLPSGMERKKLNQSTWDFKAQKAFLTVEFKFHHEKDTYSVLCHRNRTDATLLSILHSSIRLRKNAPDWLSSTFPLDFDSPALPTFTTTIYDPMHSAHHKLDVHKTLLDVLRGKHFVEFPTIELWSGDTFSGHVIVGGTGEGSTVQIRRQWKDVQPYRPPRAMKKRKVGDGKALNILGEYGSDSDASSDAEPTNNALQGLQTYEDEGSDENVPPTADDEDSMEEEGEENSADADAVETDPQVLAKLLQEARAAGKWKEEDDEVLSDGEEEVIY
ncbi:uncharacterized protein SCHCODRAFT_02577122 [Schizophyllum commune H4-8]|nr:uncharacterized protein SCHCODRAFT_02577122 [Schizophyllum commune H4-8]KAI5894266.1 hypothetical protein SCHCODRAFT_02577122 [Schizophyllum commune H4-8]